MQSRKKKLSEAQLHAIRSAAAKKAAATRRANAAKKGAPYVTGRGAYKTKNVSISIPDSVGGNIGATVGGWLGHGAQQLVKHITGFGDYSIGINSLMTGAMNPPEIKNKSGDCVCLRHREYIQDIVGSTSAFNLQVALDLNPGLVTSFPWLAGVAENFEEYRITGMIFEFKTLCSDYATGSALGYVAMATQYNSILPNFADKKTLENYEFANSSKPSESFIHPIECKRSMNTLDHLYVRTGSVPTGADQRLYDLGVFQLAVGGNPNSNTIGELWCTFEIELYKPKLVTAVGTELLTDHWVATAALGNSTPLGTATLKSGSNLGTTLSGAAGNVINFPAAISDGNFLVVYQITGSSTSTTGFTVSFTNCTGLTVWKNDTSANAGNTGTTTSTYLFTFVVNITGQSAAFTINTNGTLPATPTSMDLWITQVNGAISG